MTPSKTLIMVRHAHRNKPLAGREADNGLSAKGRTQAKALAKFYKRCFGSKKARIYSSPKTRCIETVEPIARKIKVSLETLDSLNEATSEKSADAELREKIRSFQSLWLGSKDPLTVICSHGDWIPAYLKQILEIDADVDKGGWIEITYDPEVDEKPRLRWMVQDPGLSLGSR